MSDPLIQFIQKSKAFANLRIDMFRLRSIHLGRMEVMSKLTQYKGEESVDLEEVADSMLVISIALLYEALCSYRSLVDLDSNLPDEGIEAYLNQIQEKERFFELSRKIRNMIFHVGHETVGKTLSKWKALVDVEKQENSDVITELHNLLWNYIESIFSGRKSIFAPFDDDELLEACEEAKRYGQGLR